MRSKLHILSLLTLAAAVSLTAATSSLTPVNTRDQKIVRRWSVEGGPRGIAAGANGILYVGLADRQAVIAVDSKTGAVQREIILDSADIAATKELVTMRTNADRTRLFIANGSDESVTILSLPNLGVTREITMEGEVIRDALPDPKGRFLFLLGRRVHVFDAEGDDELRALSLADPMAIAISSNGSTLAVLATEDFGNAKATVAALYDTTTWQELARVPMQTDKVIEGALFAAGDRALIAVSREHLFERTLDTRKAGAMTSSGDGRMRMKIEFGDIVNSERICLPEGSGAQIATLGPTADTVLFAERRCSSSGAFSGSSRRVTPASLYGVNAFAVAYDRDSNTLAVTDRAGYLTIYKVPRAAVAN